MKFVGKITGKRHSLATPGRKRFLKAATSRLMRRIARHLLEDTPIRVTRGYAD